MASKQPSVFSVFRNQSFTLLWFGQLISAMGSALTSLAASILVYQLTNSVTSVGLMLVATAGPTVAVGLIAGVFVDRYDRKRIMLISDLARGLLIIFVPFLVQYNILWLYAIVALTSAVTQFFDSAHASVLPEVASEKELSSANALMAISSVGATMFGFAAAGLIVAKLSVEIAFYLDGVSFGLSAILLLFTRVPRVPNIENTSLRAIQQNLKEGLRVVGDAPILRSLFIIAAPIFFIFGLQNALLLPFAIDVLGGTEFEFGLQQAAEAVGVAAGSLIMARLADRIREGQWLALSYIFMAISSIAYSFAPTIAWGIFLIGVSGFVNAPSFIGRQLVIQRATPREMRGRVNSAFFIVRDTMFVLGMALAGLADIFDTRWLFLMSSYALMAVSIVVLFLPGLGQSFADWKRMFHLLGGAEAAPRLGGGRVATRLEVDRFIEKMPEMSEMTDKEREQLATETLVAEAPGGKIVIYRGETSSSAYFILQGKVDIGYITGKGLDQEYTILNTLSAGDFFGEVAALTGAQRTTNVITDDEFNQFLIIPSITMKKLARKYEGLKEVFFTTMSERLSRVEMPHGSLLDQKMLSELRTNTVKKE